MGTKKPKIRFKGYSDEWEQHKFDDLVQIERGGSPRPIDDYITDANDGLNWVKIGDAPTQGHYITKTAEKIKPEGLSKTRRVQPGDLILSNSMTFGKPYIMGINGCIHDGWLLIRDNDKFFDLTFLCHLLGTPQMLEQYRSFAAGSTVNNLNKELVGNTIVTIPTLNEQQVLGQYFEQLDNLITLHQRKYDKLLTVKKSMLEKMFPKNGEDKPEIRFAGFTGAWERRKLGEVVMSHNAGVYISKEEYGKGTNIVGVGNIYDSDYIDGEIYRYAPIDDNKFILDENDLIYGESSLVPEGIARTMCVTKNGAGTAFAWHTRRVKIDNEKCNSHIITLELNYQKDVRNYLMAVSTQTALTGMTTEGFFGATISYPVMQEQKKISAFFRSLDSLVTLHQRKLEKLKNIKKSMLEAMFV